MLNPVCCPQDLEACKRTLEQERAAQLSHVESQRQAFAMEKSALAKRYQVRLGLGFVGTK